MEWIRLKAAYKEILAEQRYASVNGSVNGVEWNGAEENLEDLGGWEEKKEMTKRRRDDRGPSGRRG